MRKDMVRLSHASPALFCCRQASGSALDAHFRKTLRESFTPDLLQDAMAVLLFPMQTDAEVAADMKKWHGSTPDTYAPRLEAHLERWAVKELPHPFEDQDPDVIERLEDLYQQLSRYINDYLSKATSPHLRRAYIHLPKWSHPELSEGDFLPPRPDVQLDVEDLPSADMHRLLRAFLRFELNTRLFSAPNTDYLRDDIRRRTGKSQVWTWDYLDDIERITASPWETESIRCVFEYVSCLYGALAAHALARSCPRGNSWRDTDFGNDGARMAGDEPSTIRGNHNDSFLAHGFFGSYDHVSHHALDGFDELDRLLTLDRRAVRLHLFGVDGTMPKENSAAHGDRKWRDFDMGMERYREEKGIPHGPGVWAWLQIENPWCHAELRGLGWRQTCDLEETVARIFRQRAWAFFNDEQWLPDLCVFPTILELLQVYRARHEPQQRKLREERERDWDLRRVWGLRIPSSGTK